MIKFDDNDLRESLDYLDNFYKTKNTSEPRPHPGPIANRPIDQGLAVWEYWMLLMHHCGQIDYCRKDFIHKFKNNQLDAAVYLEKIYRSMRGI